VVCPRGGRYLKRFGHRNERKNNILENESGDRKDHKLGLEKRGKEKPRKNTLGESPTKGDGFDSGRASRPSKKKRPIGHAHSKKAPEGTGGAIDQKLSV